MIFTKSKHFALALTVLAVVIASQAQATAYNVMAIGDSLTNGYINGSTPASQGWIGPLSDGDLNNGVGVLHSFNFVGSQGDPGYGHEGHNAFFISQQIQDFKSGNTGNVTSALSINGGQTRGDTGQFVNINPDSPDNANIIMLMIGANGSRSGAEGLAAVQDLSTLIDILMANYLTSPSDKLLVSTLTPVAFQRKRFDTGLFLDDPENAGMDLFNQRLLDDFTGTSIDAGDGTWDSGTYASGTIAEHQDYAGQVFLLDANSAFGDEPAEALFQPDYLHYSLAGNQLLADFYTDRYFELGIQQVPSPTSGAVILVALAGAGLRRRRKAA